MDQNSSLLGSYDFKTKAGITAILVALRKSDISSAEKNELRDLVFLYTSGGGDESVRISLEQKLKTHNVRPVVTEVVPTPTTVLPFGTFRPVPTFKSPEVTVSVINEKAPSVITHAISREMESVSVAKPESISQVIDLKSEKIETPAVRPEVEERVDINLVTKPLMSKSVVESENPTVPSVANPVSINRTSIAQAANFTSQPKVAESRESVQSRTVVSNPAPVTRPAIPIINTKYLDRIREIKSDVNNKVGNPVNLVDIDNKVGREYMNALLEAMKRLNGGVAGELDAAMDRLETAYLAVEKVVSKRSLKAEVPEPVPAAPKLTEAPPPLVEKSPVPTSKLPEDMVIPKMAPRVSSESAMPLNDINTPKPFAPVSLASVAAADPKPKATEPLVKTPDNKPAAPVSSSYTHNQANNESTVSLASATPNKIESKISSLAEERKLPTFNDVPAVMQTNASEIENPLYTSEIDAGLDQLLSDWSLFKKSGLFGTGPKGREHPLFKKDL